MGHEQDNQDQYFAPWSVAGEELVIDQCLDEDDTRKAAQTKSDVSS